MRDEDEYDEEEDDEEGAEVSEGGKFRASKY